MNNKENWEYVGSCGVDSGQILFVDPCYLHDWVNGEYDDDSDYGRCCSVTLSKEGAGGVVLNKGAEVVATQTAYGDGFYPVFIMKDGGGRIVEAKIVFKEEGGQEDNE